GVVVDGERAPCARPLRDRSDRAQDRDLASLRPPRVPLAPQPRPRQAPPARARARGPGALPRGREHRGRDGGRVREAGARLPGGGRGPRADRGRRHPVRLRRRAGALQGRARGAGGRGARGRGAGHLRPPGTRDARGARRARGVSSRPVALDWSRITFTEHMTEAAAVVGECQVVIDFTPSERAAYEIKVYQSLKGGDADRYFAVGAHDDDPHGFRPVGTAATPAAALQG